MKKAKVLKNKNFQKMITYIEERAGEFLTGWLVAVLADSLDELCKDGVDHDLRSMEIVYNEFFSYKRELGTGGKSNE